MLRWEGTDGCDMLVDDGGDATLIIHEGVKYEAKFRESGELPDPASTDNKEFQCVLRVIRRGLENGETDRWTK